MKGPTIIGLLGPAGAGKSTVATYLVERYGARRYSFAEPLKEIAKRTLGFTNEQLYGTQAQKEAEDPRYGFSPRWFLQKLGTEGCRAVLGSDVWLRACLRKISADFDADNLSDYGNGLAVIEDVRFVNEAVAIRGYVGREYYPEGDAFVYERGLVWKLMTPERETTADASHASEQEWMRAPYDAVLQPQERGIAHLYELVDHVCQHHKIPMVPNPLVGGLAADLTPGESDLLGAR